MRAHAIALMLALAWPLAGATAGAASAPPPAATHEIAQLFELLAHSQCRFYRNGTWYDATRAVAHLRRKYDYLRERNLVTTTESFIDRAASQSSLSGKPYRVRCDGKAAVDSRAWFTAQLQRLRDDAPVRDGRP